MSSFPINENSSLSLIHCFVLVCLWRWENLLWYHGAKFRPALLRFLRCWARSQNDKNLWLSMLLINFNHSKAKVWCKSSQRHVFWLQTWYKRLYYSWSTYWKYFMNLIFIDHLSLCEVGSLCFCSYVFVSCLSLSLCCCSLLLFYN